MSIYIRDTPDDQLSIILETCRDEAFLLVDGISPDPLLSLVMTVPDRTRPYHLTVNQSASATGPGACLTTPDPAEVDFEEIDTISQTVNHLDPDLTPSRLDTSPAHNITLGRQVLVLFELMRDDILYGLHHHPVPIAIAALSGLLIGFMLGISLGCCYGLQSQAPASTNILSTDDSHGLADSPLDPAPSNIPLAPLAAAEEGPSCSTTGSTPMAQCSPPVLEEIFSPRPTLPRALPSFDHDLSVYMDSFVATLSLDNTATPSPVHPSSVASTPSGETCINMSASRQTSV